MIRNGWNNIINRLAVQEEWSKKGLAIADNGLNGESRKLCKGFLVLINHCDSGLRVFSEKPFKWHGSECRCPINRAIIHRRDLRLEVEKASCHGWRILSGHNAFEVGERIRHMGELHCLHEFILEIGFDRQFNVFDLLVQSRPLPFACPCLRRAILAPSPAALPTA